MWRLVGGAVRWWWLFALCLALSSAGVAVYYALSPKYYHHHGMLFIHPDHTAYARRFNISSMRIFGRFDFKRTEDERLVLMSRDVLASAIMASQGYVAYTDRPTWLGDGEALYETRPFVIAEPAGTVMPPGRIDFRLAADGSGFTWQGEVMADGRMEAVGPASAAWGDSIRLPGFALAVVPTPHLDRYLGHHMRVRVKSVDEAIDWLHDHIEVRHTGKTSSILLIEADAPTPELNDVQINAVMEACVRSLDTHRKQSLVRAIEIMDQLIAGVSTELAEIDSRMEQHRADNLDKNTLTIRRTLLGNADRWQSEMKLRSDSTLCVTYLRQITRTSVTDSVQLTYGITQLIPALAANVTQYNTLQARRLLLARTPGYVHNSEYIGLIDRLQSLHDAQVATVRSYYDQVCSQLRAGEAQRREALSMMDELNAAGMTMTLSADERATKQTLYRFLSKRKTIAEAELHAMAPDAEIIQYASGDLTRFGPSRRGMLAAIATLTLIVPIGIITVRSKVRLTLLTEQEVRRQYANDLWMGAMPTVKPVRRFGRSQARLQIEARKSRERLLITVQRIAFDLTRQTGLQTLLFTSMQPGDGKTFCSRHVAWGLASLGKRVLLVDADLHRRALSRELHLRQRRGLSEILTLDDDTPDIVAGAELADLFDGYAPDVLPAGSTPPTPAELIDSQRMSDLVGQLRLAYDYVILDMPPAGIVSDATHLAPIIDLFCVVFRRGHTPRPMMRDADTRIPRSGIRRLGIMLNGAEPARH